MAQRVGEQVVQRPAQHEPVAQHHARALYVQPNRLLIGQRLIEVKQVLHLTRQIHGLAVHDGQAVLGLGQKQHVGNHPRQAFKLFSVRFEDGAVAVGVARSAQRHLGLHHQVADGRAQLVRQIRREIGQPSKGILQAFEHFVQGSRQVGQLGRYGLGGHATVQALRRDGCGLFAHGPQWRQAPARGKPAQQAHHQRRTGHKQPQGTAKVVHEIIVVRAINGEKDTHIPSRHRGHGHPPFQPMEPPPFGGPFLQGRCCTVWPPGSHRIRKDNPRRGKQQRLVRPAHRHRQIMVSGEGFTQLPNHPRKIVRGARSANDVFGMLQLAHQFRAIKIVEMAFDGAQHHPAQEQQDGPRDRGEKQRQPSGQGQAGHQHPESSST